MLTLLLVKLDIRSLPVGLVIISPRRTSHIFKSSKRAKVKKNKQLNRLSDQGIDVWKLKLQFVSYLLHKTTLWWSWRPRQRTVWPDREKIENVNIPLSLCIVPYLTVLVLNVNWLKGFFIIVHSFVVI